jgi:hypothetical protein
MLRVTKAEGRVRTIITVEGQLCSDCVDLIETSCDEALRGKQVHLVLRDVATIDEAGRALLRRLAARGVRLRGRGVYTSYLLRALSAAGRHVPSTAVTNQLPDRDPAQQRL